MAIVLLIGSEKKIEKVEFDHTRGLTYRNECLSEIGGIRRLMVGTHMTTLWLSFIWLETRNFPHFSRT